MQEQEFKFCDSTTMTTTTTLSEVCSPTVLGTAPSNWAVLAKNACEGLSGTKLQTCKKAAKVGSANNQTLRTEAAKESAKEGKKHLDTQEERRQKMENTKKQIMEKKENKKKREEGDLQFVPMRIATETKNKCVRGVLLCVPLSPLRLCVS